MRRWRRSSGNTTEGDELNKRKLEQQRERAQGAQRSCDRGHAVQSRRALQRRIERKLIREAEAKR